MLGYYLRLAMSSLRRSPGLTALMIAAVALGIAVCVTSLTVYQGLSGNPIPWKNDLLHAVTIDNWDPQFPARERHPDQPPTQLAWRDAVALLESDIPVRSVVMFKTAGVLATGTAGARPQRALTRVTSADFFAMFDVPFRFGAGWTAAADQGPEPVIVLASAMNERLFGGANSVGRTLRWNDMEFRVVGVLDEWRPLPKFYDLNNGALQEPEEAYIPWGWGLAAELPSAGSWNCWKPEPLASFRDFVQSECVWLQVWVELADAGARQRMQSLLDTYARDQQRAGRLPRPLNNRLTPVDRWLADNDVVGSDDRVLVGLAFAFLAVCLLNTVGLLLARFQRGAVTTGVRRALGASRRQICLQHLTEAGLVCAAGAALGLALAGLLLWGLRLLYATQDGTRDGIQALAHVAPGSITTALALAVLATLVAGLYPSWRIGRSAPAACLQGRPMGFRHTGRRFVP